MLKFKEWINRGGAQFTVVKRDSTGITNVVRIMDKMSFDVNTLYEKRLSDGNMLRLVFSCFEEDCIYTKIITRIYSHDLKPNSAVKSELIPINNVVGYEAVKYF